MDDIWSDDDYFEDSWEDDGAIVAVEPEPILPRLIRMALVFLMIGLTFEYLDPALLAGRLPRECWKVIRTPDLYRDTMTSWPQCSSEKLDELYMQHFRMDQQTSERRYW